MAQHTKNAIRLAFIQLLNERPLDKISIKDIAEKSAVNRNTFYYYYADIFALVEDILQLEIEDFQAKMRRYDSWQEAFRDATAFASQNKRAIYHLYNSGNQETIRRSYHNVTLCPGASGGTGRGPGGHPGPGGILLRGPVWPYRPVAARRHEIRRGRLHRPPGPAAGR